MPPSCCNLDPPEPISIAELARLVGKVCNKETEVIGTPKPNVVTERYLRSVSKAAEELKLDLYHAL